jgi:hypothetical protein
MRIFKTRWFARFARKEGFGDKVLAEAVERAEKASSTRSLAAVLLSSGSPGPERGSRAVIER